MCKLTLGLAALTLGLDGQTIDRDTTRVDGWDQMDPDTIELFGGACGEALNGGAAAVVNIRICVG